MRFLRILGVVVSVLAAAASVWWLRNGGLNGKPAQEAKPATKLTLVVAAEPLRYGQRITDRQVRIVDWGTALPPGAYESLEAIGVNEEGPYALAVIAEGAPILKSQITGPGQKPSLSARLNATEVAVTIPVNTITGVAGFVLPEERVDIILNRGVDGRRFADVILQYIRVLAADSTPESRDGEPVQAKSITFATTREDAQRLVVATGLGEISLVLRSPMNEGLSPSRKITELEVFEDGESGMAAPASTPNDAVQPAAPRKASEVTVIRGLDRQMITVP